MNPSLTKHSFLALTLLAVIVFAAEESEREPIRLERSLEIADAGGCASYRGSLRLARTYGQGKDGRVVIEAEDAVTTNIGAEGSVGPFSSPEQNLINTDRRASLNRYVAFARGAQWERGQWKIEVTKPLRLRVWYRIFVAEPGEFTHLDSLNSDPFQTVTTFKTADPNDKTFQRWQWAKGRECDFKSGTNIFIIDWHNAARLDQVAFLPDGTEPKGNEPFSPTYLKAESSAVVTLRPVKLNGDETAQELLVKSDEAGGQMQWEVSKNDGTTWSPVTDNRRLPADMVRGGEKLIFRVKLTESPQHVTPLVQAVRLVITKPRPSRELGAVPAAMQFREPAIPLVPATWSGLRWIGPEQSAAGGASKGRDGAWTLMKPVQPDAQGVFWMDAAQADFIDLLPSCRSWIGEVPGSVTGKAIRQGLFNRNVISFDVNVPKKDKYRPWFRVQLAREKVDPSFHPTVTYQFERQPLTVVNFKELVKDYPVESFRKREWVWLPGKEIETEAGVQTFRLRAGLNYTWLNRVCLAPAVAPAPQGAGGTSGRATAAGATVTFQPLARVMAKSWEEVRAESASPGGLLSYSCSLDGGGTWTELKDGGFDRSAATAASDLILRGTLAADSEGHLPRIRAWKVAAEEADEPLIQLANREQKIIFDPAGGDLLGWWSAQAGWIIPPGRRQPLFELGLPDGVARPDARNLQRRETAMRDGASALSLEYLLESGSIVAKVRIELPEKGLARWKLRVENHSSCQVYGLNFPIIGGVRIGNQAEANRAPVIDGMSTEGSGTLFHPIAKFNPTSGLYPGWTSMGWYSLYSAEPIGSFTLQTRNKDAYHIWMTQDNDPAATALHYKFSRMLVVDPEKSGEAEYDIGWQEGDWHGSADLYRQWARTWMKKVENPAWVKNADGWVDNGNTMLASRYITHAWPNMEWLGANYSQNFSRSVEAICSSSPFPYINPRLGTAEEFRQAHAAARKHDWYNTYYLNHAWSDKFADAEFLGPTPRRLLPPELRLQPRGFAEKWALQYGDGSFCLYCDVAHLNYAPCYRMCGTGLVDMLVDGVAYNYGTVLGADGVYLDQSACCPGFCFNPNHGHGTQRAVMGGYMIEGMRRSIASGRKDNPNFAMAVEGNCDQCMQYANFGLFVGNILCEGDVFKYTFPEVQLIKGHCNDPQAGGLLPFGDYARHLNLFMVNSLNGTQHDLKEFYAHRKRIGDWMHGGEFQDNVGLTISKPGIDAKWFRRSDPNHVGAAVNIHNEDRIAGAVLRLKWPELRNVSKAFAYLWGGEVKSLTVRWENDGAVVEIPSAQAATILLIAKAPKNEAVRGHCFWPLSPGPDKLVLVLVNTSNQDQTVELTYQTPAGVTLKAPPSKRRVSSGEVARIEVAMEGIGSMKQRGRVEVQAREFSPTVFTAGCVVAPPLVNGGFETDSMGNGTPGMWQGNFIDILTQILQLKELPPIVCNEKEVIHHADGFIDQANPAEGKNALLLPGRLMLPWFWRDPNDKSPISNRPFYFKSRQPLILKSGTKYHLSFKQKQEADDGLIEVSAAIDSWCVESPAFAPLKIPAVKSERGWQTYTYEFETPIDLAGPPELQFVNNSAGKAWIDDVRVEEVGAAQ